MTTTCAAQRTPIRIESQIEQLPICHLPWGHDGPHAGILLDSDDRPITERWANTGPRGSDEGQPDCDKIWEQQLPADEVRWGWCTRAKGHSGPHGSRSEPVR